MNRTMLLAASTALGLATLATPALAGDLNPSGPPAPTMKTLDEIPGSWHRILPAAQRFRLVMPAVDPGCVNDPPISICVPLPQAVLDLETGLVWEESPGDANRDGVVDAADARSWGNAHFTCIRTTTGGRQGWRLPTIHELMSLMDPGAGTFAHRFSSVPPPSLAALYWTATTDVADPGKALTVNASGSVFASPKPSSVDGGFHLLVWCVRGGNEVDAR